MYQAYLNACILRTKYSICVEAKIYPFKLNKLSVHWLVCVAFFSSSRRSIDPAKSAAQYKCCCQLFHVGQFCSSVHNTFTHHLPAAIYGTLLTDTNIKRRRSFWKGCPTGKWKWMFLEEGLFAFLLLLLLLLLLRSATIVLRVPP